MVNYLLLLKQKLPMGLKDMRVHAHMPVCVYMQGLGRHKSRYPL